MAGRRHQKLLEQSYRYIADDFRRGSAAAEELQEADVWGDFESDQADAVTTEGEVEKAPTARSRRGRVRPATTAATAARSVPVNVPAWGRKAGRWPEDGEESDGDGEVVPPHIYLWRRRRASEDVEAAYSVEEGLGRTLKGRDLRRVRNAVWEKIGFLD